MFLLRNIRFKFHLLLLFGTVVSHAGYYGSTGSQQDTGSHYFNKTWEEIEYWDPFNGETFTLNGDTYVIDGGNWGNIWNDNTNSLGWGYHAVGARTTDGYRSGVPYRYYEQFSSETDYDEWIDNNTEPDYTQDSNGDGIADQVAERLGYAVDEDIPVVSGNYSPNEFTNRTPYDVSYEVYMTDRYGNRVYKIDEFTLGASDGVNHTSRQLGDYGLVPEGHDINVVVRSDSLGPDGAQSTISQGSLQTVSTSGGFFTGPRDPDSEAEPDSVTSPHDTREDLSPESDPTNQDIDQDREAWEHFYNDDETGALPTSDSGKNIADIRAGTGHISDSIDDLKGAMKEAIGDSADEIVDAIEESGEGEEEGEGDGVLTWLQERFGDKSGEVEGWKNQSSSDALNYASGASNAIGGLMPSQVVSASAGSGDSAIDFGTVQAGVLGAFTFSVTQRAPWIPSAMAYCKELLIWISSVFFMRWYAQFIKETATQLLLGDPIPGSGGGATGLIAFLKSKASVAVYMTLIMTALVTFITLMNSNISVVSSVAYQSKNIVGSGEWSKGVNFALSFLPIGHFVSLLSLQIVTYFTAVPSIISMQCLVKASTV